MIKKTHKNTKTEPLRRIRGGLSLLVRASVCPGRLFLRGFLYLVIIWVFYGCAPNEENLVEYVPNINMEEITREIGGDHGKD